MFYPPIITRGNGKFLGNGGLQPGNMIESLNLTELKMSNFQQSIFHYRADFRQIQGNAECTQPGTVFFSKPREIPSMEDDYLFCFFHCQDSLLSCATTHVIEVEFFVVGSIPRKIHSILLLYRQFRFVIVDLELSKNAPKQDAPQSIVSHQIYTYNRAHLHIYIYIYIYIHNQKYTYAYIHCVHKNTYIYIHIYMEYECKHINMYIPTYPPTHSLTHSVSQSLTPSLARSLPHSLSHSLTH